MPAVILPAPVALARLVGSLTPARVADPVWEPKWDGYRALTAGGRIYSRNGTDLTRLFPDLAPVLAGRLPADLVLDGELVIWDNEVGRLDFAGLQARMTAGRRIRSIAAHQPAQFVAFDVLAADDEDLRDRPLWERRAILERALSRSASPIVLCQQTDHLATAREWFRSLKAGGIEGLVVKDKAGTYPTQAGRRVWWKVKAKTTIDMLAIGFTGPASLPTSLVLAFPGDVSEAGQPVTAGSTTTLSKPAAKSVTPLLRPTGASIERTFAWGSSEPSTVTLIESFVVEVEADASAEMGALRHAARLHRVRPDLDPSEAS